MLAKTLTIFALVAAAQAAHTGGLYDNTLSLGTQSEATVRGLGGFNTVSHQTKAIDSAHASVRKYDTRISNDAAFAARPIGYAGYAGAPLAAHGYAAPAVAYGHGPAAVAYGHGYASPALAGYGAPALAGYASPALAGYASPALAGYASPALAGYGAPALAHGYAAPALAHGYAAPIAKAVGVGHPALAYSPAAAVATHSFNGFGISYGY